MQYINEISEIINEAGLMLPSLLLNSYIFLSATCIIDCFTHGLSMQESVDKAVFFPINLAMEYYYD